MKWLTEEELPDIDWDEPRIPVTITAKTYKRLVEAAEAHKTTLNNMAERLIDGEN